MKLIPWYIAVFQLSCSGQVYGQQLDWKALQTKAEKAQEYSVLHKLDTNTSILIDMSIHSGFERLFVWNHNTDTVAFSGLVSHGCGRLPWGDDGSKSNPVFSNVPESHCSSLGHFRIGKRGYSNWGIHVNNKLYGLDSSNSNAYQRFIVLHSWNAVSDLPIFPTGTPEGWGCPAVSNAVMVKIDQLLQAKQQSVLLWMYD